MRLFLFYLTICAGVIGFPACEEEGRDLAVCGNAVVESGEDCDSNRFAVIFSRFCTEWGYNDGTVACSPECRLDFTSCEASGRCGDGLITAGFETCDGTNFGGATCESLGDHGGALACTPDCRVDRSGCASCGDGVLQAEYGELVEVGFDGCAEAGHFGGVITTPDCQVASGILCGDYRLITGPGSVKDPVLAFDSVDQLVIGGIVQGSFSGFDNPGCPHPAPMSWESPGMEGPEEHRDGYHYPYCDDHFLASLPADSPLVATLQHPDAAPPQALLPLGSAGFAQLRHTTEEGDWRFVIDWISPQGTKTHTEVVDHDAGRGEPQWVAAAPDEFALVTFPAAGAVLRISRFSVEAPGLLATAELGELEYGGRRYVPNPYSNAVGVLGVSAGVYRVFSSFKVLGSDPAEVADFLLTLEVVDTGVTVSDVLPLDLSGATWIRLNPTEEAGGLELVWNAFDGEVEVSTVHAAGLDAAGTWLWHTAFAPPPDHIPWTAHRLPGGDLLVGGAAYSPGPLEPSTPVCDGLDGPNGNAYLFAMRFSPLGVPGSRRYFGSPSFQFTGIPNDPRERACGVSRVRMLPDGEALLFTGTWDRSAYFCSAQEPPTQYLLEPLHACGIYLVRIEP